MQIFWLLGALLLCVLPEVSAQTSGYQAAVGTDSATFEFPLDPDQLYEWSGGGLTYQWSVAVPGAKCEIGFYLFTAQGASAEESGDIHKLLQAGQFSAWCGGKVRNDLIVDGFANGAKDRLTLQLKGKKAVRTFFEARPKFLTFATLLELYEKPSQVRVPVTYAELAGSSTSSLTEKDAKFMASDRGVQVGSAAPKSSLHGKPGFYFTINTCNGCCYDWHETAAKNFSSNGLPALVVFGQERTSSETKGFAPLRKFEKVFFKDVARDSEICAQGTLYVGPFPTQTSALQAVEKFPPLLFSIIKNRGTDDIYTPEQLRSLETATVVQDGSSNNWSYGNEYFFTISGYQLVQSRVSLRSEATKSWPLFWAKFSKAVKEKDFVALVKLSASDEEFFDGGGGGNSLEWFNMMSDEWPTVKRAVMNGVTPIKVEDWNGETRVERTTRKQELIFLYAGQRWFFVGVMGD